MKFLKVQAVEIAIGGIVFLGAGVAAVSPFTAGLHSINPMTAPGLIGFLQASLLVVGGVLGAALGTVTTARQERDSHIRGHRFYNNYAQAAEALQQRLRRSFSAAQLESKIHGINIGGVELSRAQEVRHTVLVGTSGAGKTALLNSIIDQVLARGSRVLIHDPGGDFTERYYDPANTVLLGPWDERAAIWDAAVDIGTPALVNEFATATVGRVQGENKSFYDGAATVLSGLIQSFMVSGQPWTWGQLASALALPPEAMAAIAVQGVPEVRTAVSSAFGKGDGLDKGDHSKFSIIGSATRWIKNYAVRDRYASKRFSITNWLLGRDHDDIRIVILNSNPQYQGACEAIFGALLNCAVAMVNSAAMPLRSPDEPGDTWMFLDELPQMGAAAMESVQKISELGRKRGFRAWLVMQAESQLAGVVGIAKAKPMLEVQGMRICTQCSPEVAAEVSKRIGERDVNRISTTNENGAFAGKRKELARELVINPSDLTALEARIGEAPNGVEMVMHVGDVLGRLLQPFPSKIKRAEPFIESEIWKYGTLPGWLEKHQANVSELSAAAGRDENTPVAILDTTLPPDIASDPTPAIDDIDSLLKL